MDKKNWSSVVEGEVGIATKPNVIDDERLVQDAVITKLQANQFSKDEALYNLQVKQLEYQSHIKELYEQLKQADKRLEDHRQSTIWRLTSPLRYFLEKLPRLRTGIRRGAKLFCWTISFKLFKKLTQRKQTLDYFANLNLTPASNIIQNHELTTVNSNKLTTIFFASGEADTPGHFYRIERYAEAAKTAGYGTVVFPVDKARDFLHQITFSSIIFIWRAMWSAPIVALYETAKAAGAKIVFDIDDFMFEPRLATKEVIDGIRSLNVTEEEVRHHYTEMHRTFSISDAGSAPTDFLAAHMRRYSIPAFVLPNGFDENTLLKSRLAVRARHQKSEDGLIRIGYAAGTLTHQRDFAQASSSLAKILAEFTHCRLVLFRADTTDILDVSEFPEFKGLENQIEWRTKVCLDQLPAEIARFDINIAPLEWDNIFCNAKSQLKYFEAALVEVPTIASPTDPYARAIRPNITGFLARTAEEWYNYLKLLIENAPLRQTIARGAYYDVLWTFGPERRVQMITSFVEQLRRDPQRVANAFELELARKSRVPAELTLPNYRIVYEQDNLQFSPVTILVPLYNYAKFIAEALESVKEQTFENLDLVIVDDMSTDNSLAVAQNWINDNNKRFNRIILAQNCQNSGLSLTRNVGFHLAESTYVLPLDPDNKLLKNCVDECVSVLDKSPAAFAYPYIQQFGDAKDVIGLIKFHPALFTSLNFIDAMALIRKTAWAAVGGYFDTRLGWEDYEFWCRCVEFGFIGIQIPQILAAYRVHKASMLHTTSNKTKNRNQIIDILQEKHAWLYLETLRDSESSVE